MILTEVRNYVQQQPMVSLKDLCLRFHTDEMTMENLLGFWVQKNKISPVISETNCGGCVKNTCTKAQYYQWVS